jgi:hypothetical protein
MAQVLQMHPDLMGPPGVEFEPKEVDHVEPGNYRNVGAGFPPPRGYSHALPVLRVPGHRRVDSQRTRVQVTPSQGCVAAPHSASGYSCTEPPLRQIRFRHDHQSGGVAVQAVDDARPSLRPSGQRGPPGNQGIYQSVVPVTWSGVNYQTGRLIDDGQVLILEHEGERNGGWLEGTRWLFGGKLDRHSLTAREEPGRAGRLAVDRDQLVGDEAGSLGAGDAQLVGEEPVEAFGLRAENRELDFLASPLPRCHIMPSRPTPAPPGARPRARVK